MCVRPRARVCDGTLLSYIHRICKDGKYNFWTFHKTNFSHFKELFNEYLIVHFERILTKNKSLKYSKKDITIGIEK